MLLPHLFAGSDGKAEHRVASYHDNPLDDGREKRPLEEEVGGRGGRGIIHRH